MRFGIVIVGWVVGFALLGAAQAEESHLCIRGKSFEPGREFLQTRQPCSASVRYASPAKPDVKGVAGCLPRHGQAVATFALGHVQGVVGPAQEAFG